MERGDQVILNKIGFPLLTIAHVLNGTLFFKESNYNALPGECGLNVRLTENGGREIELTAAQFDLNRSYWERKDAIISLF